MSLFQVEAKVLFAMIEEMVSFNVLHKNILIKQVGWYRWRAQNHSGVTLKVAMYPPWTGKYFKMCFSENVVIDKHLMFLTRYTPLLNEYL